MTDFEREKRELKIIEKLIKQDFYRKVKSNLIEKQLELVPDMEISIEDAVACLCFELEALSEANNLNLIYLEEREMLFVSINPYPILMGINREKGSIHVSLPEIGTKDFKYFQWNFAVHWVSDYITVDKNPLTERYRAAKDQFLINSKMADIIKNSISEICKKYLCKEKQTYRLIQRQLVSVIDLETEKGDFFEFQIFHKSFGANASTFVQLLQSPQEMKIENVMSCFKRPFSPNNEERWLLSIGFNDI